MIRYLAYILLFFLPFHAFISTLFRFEFGVDKFWLWKELFLIIILIINLGYREMGKLKKAYINWLSLLIIAYGIFIAASALWAPSFSIGRIIVGMKFDYVIFVALITGMSFAHLGKEEFHRLLSAAFWGGSLAIVSGVLLHFVLGPENFTMFGYRDDWSTYKVNQGLAFCQKIENKDLCRFQGTFSGPNQAGFYILFYLPLAFYFLKNLWKDKIKRILISLSVIAALVALVLTFSRSAWIAFALELVLMTVFVFRAYLNRNLLIRLIVFGGLGLVATLAIIIAVAPEVVIRPISNFEHFSKWLEGIVAFNQSPLIGSGIGQAGPATRVLGEPELIPENWFLQIAVEYGLVGLIMFVGIYFKLLQKLCSKKTELGLIFFIILIALLVPAQLLHVFEDSVLSYSLMLLVGAYLVTDTA